MLGEHSVAAGRKSVTWGPEKIFLVKCENPTPREPPWIGTVAAMRISTPAPPSTRSMCSSAKADASDSLALPSWDRLPSSSSCHTARGYARSRTVRCSGRIRPSSGSRANSRATYPHPAARTPSRPALPQSAIPATPKPVHKRALAPSSSSGDHTSIMHERKRSRYLGNCPACDEGRKRKCLCGARR